MAEIDELTAEIESREADAREAEKDLIERLERHGYGKLWESVRAGLHCERFLESRTGKRVIDRLIRTVIDAQTEWLLAPDPATREITEAHRRAQAAHMAIFSLGEVLSEGEDAERELAQIERELGE